MPYLIPEDAQDGDIFELNDGVVTPIGKDGDQYLTTVEENIYTLGSEFTANDDPAGGSETEDDGGGDGIGQTPGGGPH